MTFVPLSCGVRRESGRRPLTKASIVPTDARHGRASLPASESRIRVGLVTSGLERGVGVLSDCRT